MKRPSAITFVGRRITLIGAAVPLKVLWPLATADALAKTAVSARRSSATSG